MILVPNSDYTIAHYDKDLEEFVPLYKKKLGLVKRNSYDSQPTELGLIETDYLQLYDMKDIAKMAKQFDYSQIRLINELYLFGYEDNDSGKSPIFFA